MSRNWAVRDFVSFFFLFIIYYHEKSTRPNHSRKVTFFHHFVSSRSTEPLLMLWNHEIITSIFFSLVQIHRWRLVFSSTLCADYAIKIFSFVYFCSNDSYMPITMDTFLCTQFLAGIFFPQNFSGFYINQEMKLKIKRLMRNDIGDSMYLYRLCLVGTIT